MPPGLLSPWMGTYGVTFLIIFAAMLLIESKRGGRWCGAAILVLVYLSVTVRSGIEEQPKDAVDVVLVQEEGGAFKHHLDHCARVVASVDVFVWPEHSVPYNLMEQERQLPELQAFLGERDAIAVVGTRRAAEDEKYASIDSALRWFNTAAVISPDQILGFHDKNHPVHFFKDGIPGANAKSIDTPVGRIGTPICFDVDYQSVVRQMTLDGAEFILAPTMDQRNWTEKQHNQHAQLFRHRAAENGRWIGVSATSGVTQIIDSAGRSRAQLPLMKDEVVWGTMYRRVDLTVFTRWGWLIGPVCMWLAPVVVLVITARRLRNSLASRRVTQSKVRR